MKDCGNNGQELLLVVLTDTANGHGLLITMALGTRFAMESNLPASHDIPQYRSHLPLHTFCSGSDRRNIPVNSNPIFLACASDNSN
jgi:hypothetical protein